MKNRISLPFERRKDEQLQGRPRKKQISTRPRANNLNSVYDKSDSKLCKSVSATINLPEIVQLNEYEKIKV